MELVWGRVNLGAMLQRNVYSGLDIVELKEWISTHLCLAVSEEHRYSQTCDHCKGDDSKFSCDS